MLYHKLPYMHDRMVTDLLKGKHNNVRYICILQKLVGLQVVCNRKNDRAEPCMSRMLLRMQNGLQVTCVDSNTDGEFYMTSEVSLRMQNCMVDQNLAFTRRLSATSTD